MCADTPGDLAAPIAILARQQGAGAATSALASASTAPDGAYALTVASVTANTTFIVRSAGAHNAHTVVKVLPLVTLTGPAGTQLTARGAPRGGGPGGAARNRIAFSGTISPASPGTRVALQSSYGTSGEHWRTIGFARVDGDGRFALLHSFRTPGEVSLRAVTHPKGATLGASQPLTYEITQAQNTALTIETSKDPIIFGQSLTISGAAAGPAPQQVTLFAHAPGHPFAAIASASTGEGGSYAFSVSPRTSTAYQVRTATESSTVLFEGLRYRLTQDAPPASVAALTPLTLSGTLVPAPAGQRVLLEQQNGSGQGFHVLATGSLDSLGHFTLTCVFARPGSYVLRIKVPGGPSSQAGFGAPFTIAVVGGAPAEASEAGEEATAPEPESGEATEPTG